jgi:hypothetical protein
MRISSGAKPALCQYVYGSKHTGDQEGRRKTLPASLCACLTLTIVPFIKEKSIV